MPLQVQNPLFWHHPIITYSNPMAWMQPVGHNIERKIVDYWSTAELNPVESKVFLIKSFLWNRLWTDFILRIHGFLALFASIWSIILFQSESLNDIEIISNKARHNLINAKCRWRSDRLDGAGSFLELLGHTQVMQICQGRHQVTRGP